MEAAKLDVNAMVSVNPASTGTVTGLGYAWLPYAIAAVALMALALVAATRSRSQSETSLAQFLMIRGSVLAVLAVTVGLLADAASEGDGLTLVDRPIWSWMIDHRTRALTAVFTVITQIGSTVAMTILASVITVALLVQRPRRPDGVLVAVVAIGAGLLVAIAKPVVGRVRPPAEFRLVSEGNQSFPSGHALATAAILGVIAVVFVPSIQRRVWQVLTIAAITMFVLLVGLSRLYLGVHWSTDVVGGWLTGSAWLLLCLTLRRLLRTYPAVRRLLEPGVRGDRV